MAKRYVRQVTNCKRVQTNGPITTDICNSCPLVDPKADRMNDRKDCKGYFLDQNHRIGKSKLTSAVVLVVP